MFTGTVIDARRVTDDADGATAADVNVIYKVLYTDGDRKEMTAPELGQAMAMWELWSKSQDQENEED